MITNKNYNVDFASLADKKLMYDFAKEMYFDVKAPSNKSIRDRTLIKFFESPGLMVFDSSVSKKSVSKIIFLSENPNELCDRWKLLLQEKQARNSSDIITEESIAIVDKL